MLSREARQPARGFTAEAAACSVWSLTSQSKKDVKVVPPAGVLDFLRNLYGTISYHWWDELYSGRTNGWLDAAVHYNLDPNGNVAVAFSYQHGRTEDTGTDTDVYKVTLTAKTCTDIFNMKSCGGP